MTERASNQHRKADALPRVHQSVVHMLADAAERAGESTAITFEERRLTYRGYLRCVAGFATELVKLGARKERVALVCNNSLEMAVATFAAHAAGAQAVPINPIYTARELTHILRDSEPTVIIYDASTAATVEPLVEKLGVPHSIRIGGSDGRRLDGWRDDAGAELPKPLPSPGDFANLLYTGGTTGEPKGVNITHGQIAVNISQREALLPTRFNAERVLCIMPLFHVFATAMCLHLTTYCCGHLFVLPRYRPDLMLDALEKERITILPAGPTVFIGLMGYEGFAQRDFSSLRVCYSGSAPLPAETLKRWQELTGCRVLEGYGQTESGPVLTFVPERGVIKPGFAGVPVPLTEIQIVDVETGTKLLPVGEMGEVRARGPQIMSSYRNRPQETAEALRDGWLYTGDIGFFEPGGYLAIRDRKKDMAIVGGFNVYTREIDEVLYAHPAVAEAASVGVPDPYRGEIVKAWVALKPGMTTTVEALAGHCRENLAKYKLPAAIEIVSAIPKTPVGKIDKKALRG